MAHRRFPRSFVWGVAAAAPQIEGAAFEDGKGESTWDRFSRTSPTVLNGDTLDVACDHYHRFEDDLRLMRDLGIRHYRLSLAWPRILPAGTGAVNPKGLGFYDRLIDRMLHHGITPWVTLFHWDTPQALEEQGGWRNRATAEAYGEYARIAVRHLGDRVKRWFTLNEIRCFTLLSYSGGLDKAPGLAVPRQEMHQAVHHALVAHGLGVRAVREFGGRGAKVGLVDNPDCTIPVSETPDDIAAARRVWRERNAWILGAAAQGRYEASFLRAAGKDRPVAARGDLALIGEPCDFVGLNVYTGQFVRAGRKGPEALPFPPEYPAFCKTGWLRPAPQCISWALRFAHEDYGYQNLYITENGIGHMREEPEADGEVLDLYRREYYRSYLAELHQAITEKVPVRGYFAWSIMDNYEWADGYSTRFGLVRTDFATQRRTPKLSARWFSQVVQANRLL